jgi:hypothetical protein
MSAFPNQVNFLRARSELQLPAFFQKRLDFGALWSGSVRTF